MVRRGDEHQAVTILGIKCDSRGTNCGGCVARRWLDKNILWRNLNGGKLLDHHEAEVRASNDRWRGEADT